MRLKTFFYILFANIFLFFYEPYVSAWHHHSFILNNVFFFFTCQHHHLVILGVPPRVLRIKRHDGSNPFEMRWKTRKKQHRTKPTFSCFLFHVEYILSLFFIHQSLSRVIYFSFCKCKGKGPMGERVGTVYKLQIRKRWTNGKDNRERPSSDNVKHLAKKEKNRLNEQTLPIKKRSG